MKLEYKNKKYELFVGLAIGHYCFLWFINWLIDGAMRDTVVFYLFGIYMMDKATIATARNNIKINIDDFIDKIRKAKK